jgi:acyl-CoA synthetase (AMP-forming)/AMP-acid ligase II
MSHQQTVVTVLDNAAEQFGARTALVAGNDRWTFARLRDESVLAAHGLRALGVGRGDRIAIWLPNRLEWAVAFYAAARAGAIVVPLNTGLTRSEASYQLAQSGSSLIVTTDIFRDRALATEALELGREAGLDLRVVVVGTDVPDGAEAWSAVVAQPAPELAVEPEPLPEVRPGDPIVVLYTSGTTGLPKGAVHTHRFLPTLLAAQQRLRLSEDDCVVLYLPLFHVYALMAGLVLMTAVGAKLVLMGRFNAAASLALMVDEGASIVYGVPTTYIDQLAEPAIATADLSRIRVSITPFAFDLCERVSARFGVCLNTFGMTETASMALLPQLDDDPEIAMRTVGTPLDGLQARVVDERTGAPLPPGVSGALQLRGDLITSGYWDKPVETAEAFDSEGWFGTGDLARIDNHGNVTFVGRQGDHYRVGGESVDPLDVETALQTHPAVERAAVVGVPDDRLGAVGHAWVQLRRGAEGVEPDALRRHIAARIAFFKVPREVYVVAELPTTPSGKVQKFKLREQLAQNSAGGDAAI